MSEEVVRDAQECDLRGTLVISPVEETIDESGAMVVIINRKVHTRDIFFSGKAEPINPKADKFALVVKDGDRLVRSDVIMPTEILDYHVWSAEDGDYILSLSFKCVKVNDIGWMSNLPMIITPIIAYKTAMLATVELAIPDDSDDSKNLVVNQLRTKYAQVNHLGETYYLQDVVQVSVTYHIKDEDNSIHGEVIHFAVIYCKTPIRVASDCKAVLQIYQQIKNNL